MNKTCGIIFAILAFTFANPSSAGWNGWKCFSDNAKLICVKNFVNFLSLSQDDIKNHCNMSREVLLADLAQDPDNQHIEECLEEAHASESHIMKFPHVIGVITTVFLSVKIIEAFIRIIPAWDGNQAQDWGMRAL